jgi:hypothetical protein
MGLLDRGTGMEGKQIGEQEQQTLDIFAANGVKLIHTEQVSDAIHAKIKASADKIEAIASVLLDIIGRIEASAIAKKIVLTSTVIVHGANYLLAEIINLAEKAGLVEPLNDEQRKQAFSIATSRYIDDAVKSGKITPEQLNQMSQQFQATPQGQEIAARLKQQQGGPAAAQSGAAAAMNQSQPAQNGG